MPPPSHPYPFAGCQGGGVVFLLHTFNFKESFCSYMNRVWRHFLWKAVRRVSNLRLLQILKIVLNNWRVRHFRDGEGLSPWRFKCASLGHFHSCRRQIHLGNLLRQLQRLFRTPLFVAAWNKSGGSVGCGVREFILQQRWPMLISFWLKSHFACDQLYQHSHLKTGNQRPTNADTTLSPPKSTKRRNSLILRESG